jgi:hypothetical protein
MVKEDKITAIIDCEYAGYYPWWAERWLKGDFAQNRSDELLNPLWPQLSPNMDPEKYEEEVSDRLIPVIRYWKHCSISHPKCRDMFYRPAFSASEP